MKIQVTHHQLILASAWVGSFCLCLFAAIWVWVDAPTQREPFIKNAVEAFAPGLGVMLAAVFARKKSRSNNASTNKPAAKMSAVDVLAFVVASAYLLAFVLPVIQFLGGWIENLGEVNKIFSTVRPNVTWFVVPVIAYYFGSKPS